jgi:hypothetical protein
MPIKNKTGRHHVKKTDGHGPRRQSILSKKNYKEIETDHYVQKYVD